MLARGLSVRDIEDAVKDESRLLRFAHASAVSAFLSNELVAMVWLEVSLHGHRA
jgi:hypothetical protein